MSAQMEYANNDSRRSRRILSHGGDGGFGDKLVDGQGPTEDYMAGRKDWRKV